MKSRLPLPALLAVFMLLATSAGAQQSGPDGAARADENSATAETNDSPTLSNDDEAETDDAGSGTQADDAADEADESRPVNASTDVFVPTEEVSVDRSISMPVDI